MQPLGALAGALAVLALALPARAYLPPAVPSQQQDDGALALDALNRARAQNGLAPLAPNATLERAARKKADAMAARGVVDPLPADNAAAAAAQAEAGYPAWRSGARVAGALVYASTSGFGGATAFFLDQDRARRVLLDRLAREVGIAVAFSDGPGGRTAYWSVITGAQPNGLPIFLDDGAAVSSDPLLAVRLTQEDAVPAGEGANTVGRIVDVRLSESADFAGALWQPWEPLIAYTLRGEAGVRTVYAQLRDGAGRVAVSAASIVYDPRSRPSAQPVAPGSEVTRPAPATAVPQPGLTPLAATSLASPTPPAPLVITLSPGSIVATPNLPPAAAAARPSTAAPPIAGQAPALPGPAPRPEPDPMILIAAVTAQAVVLGIALRRLVVMRSARPPSEGPTS